MLFILSVSAVKAQSGWSCDERAFMYDMTYYLSIKDEDNATVADLSKYEVAVFVGDECRGVAEVSDNKQYMYLRVRSNSASGEKFKFKVFDLDANEEVANKTADQTFTSNGTQGMPSKPFMVELGENDVLLGDVNGDGKINSVDLALLIGKILGKEDSRFIDAAGDLDGNGKYNSVDLSLLIKLILNQ